MTSPDAMLIAARERIRPTFLEVVERRRARFDKHGWGPLEDPVGLLMVALRVHRWRRRRPTTENE